MSDSSEAAVASAPPTTGVGGAESRRKTPRVTVVVSELNSVRTIRRCVECLLHQDYPREFFRVVVVDAASNDGTLSQLESLSDPRLSILVHDGISEAAGQIKGFEAFPSDILMFTNSDVYVPVNWISSHVAWHLRGCNIVGGRTLHEGDLFMFAWNVARTRGVKTAATEGEGYGFGNFSVDSETYLGCGGLHEVGAQQDAEFCYRAFATGAKGVIDPLIETIHDHPLGSLRNSVIRSYGYAFNHMLLVRQRSNGSFRPAPELGVEFSVANLVRELTGIQGVLAYYDCKGRNLPPLPSMSLLHFLWFRQAGHNLGKVLGLLRSLTARYERAHVLEFHAVRAD